MEIIKKIALVLTIIGAINWLLIGLFDVNLVTMIFGDAKNIIVKIIYILIGISGLIAITELFDDKK